MARRPALRTRIRLAGRRARPGDLSCRIAACAVGAFEGKRRVASFGWRYDFSDQRLHAATPFPSWIVPVVTKVEAFADLPVGAIQHILFT